MRLAESAARCGDGTAGSDSHRPTVGMNYASGTCWFIPVTIGMEMMEMLVDTGSGMSLLSREVYDSMGARRPKLKGLSTNLTMANGFLMEADGKARFSMSIAGQRHRASMVVGELKGVKGILGMDFLMRNRADMDLAKGVSHLHGRAVPMHKEAPVLPVAGLGYQRQWTFHQAAKCLSKLPLLVTGKEKRKGLWSL